ncbi:MBL fold metallo-hydrolase [Agarilytica rhodophyticola]|uniref:MBL fold metallo-hydrolase n=1 Tax=Agarilytica rhodophyticola TaxID=1737490 RepID=UPI000CD8FD01|nr:MBL fold metallo-hydrolase [Agarilytica rhodophyticola]
MSKLDNMLSKKSLIVLVIVLLLVLLILFLNASSGVTRNYKGFSVSTFSESFINVHLISDGTNHFLIDSGLDKQFGKIEKFLLDHRVDPKNLKAIIVTHGHHDHAGTAAYFQNKYGIKIIGGAGDLKLFDQGKNDRLCSTGTLASLRHPLDQSGKYPTFTPDIVINNRAELAPITGISGFIEPVPGHTEGSLVIVVGKVAFVGDMFRGSMTRKDKAEMHFYQCNITKLKEGLEKTLKQLALNVDIFFPSHMGPVSRKSVENLLNEMVP